MITEDYVSFEVAKLLKEKGFKDIVQSLWIGEDEHHYISTESIIPDDYNSGGTCLYSAPTHQMVLKWLRETHNFIILVEYDIFLDKFYCYIRKRLSDYIIPTDSYDSYEQAVESAIKYCLENLV